MNNPHIPEAIDGEIDVDLHPFAREQEEQEPEAIVLSNASLLERRQQEQAQSRWW